MIGNNNHYTSWHKKQSYSVCDICGEPKPYNKLSRLPIWGQSFCQKHGNDGTPRCYSCTRFKTTEVEYINYGHGRKLCPDCDSSAITDMNKCRPLIPKVYQFLNELNLQVQNNIPIFLVDEHELRKVTRITRDSLGAAMFHAQDIKCVKSCLKRGKTMEIMKETQRPRKQKVAAILLLFGMPRVCVGATLAHELMHAWMKHQGCHSKLKSKVAEGICEVIAHKWLECYDLFDDPIYNSGEEAQFVSNLKEYSRLRLELNSSDVYGNGFRDAKYAVEKYGLDKTLKYVVKNYKLPHV